MSKMKMLTIVLTSVLLMQTEAYLIKVPTTAPKSKIGPVDWVQIQKLLLPLFENVCEVSTDPIISRLNEEFKLDPTIGNYLKTEVIANLLNLKSTKGLLAKGETFSEYDSDHLNELKVVYEALYYAKDFDTFYKTASWARQNINCGVFVDAIYLAVITRRDTEKVAVPPPYELLPNYFIRKDLILKASSLIREKDIATNTLRNEGNTYVLDVNTTTNSYDESDDKLAYFHEDIGLNTYYFFTKLKNCQWLNDIRDLQHNNGGYIYHSMKQLMARYNLERYSNGLPEIEGIDWDYIYDLPFDPMLVYSNGISFSERTSVNNNNEIIGLLKNIENNLPQVVIHMKDNGYNKSEILNHLMKILVTNERSYENLAIQILSDNNGGTFSVLEHYLTSVRDPIFWKINRKIVDMVDKALSILPSYTNNQLYFPGVKVQNIEVKKLMTLFDNFEFDVTDALKTNDEKIKFQIKIAQPRLNHKPFAFKISIASLVTQKALVKIFIGPKIFPGELIEKKNLFMLLDCFEANLKIGNNLLSRTSNEMTSLSEDLVSLSVIHRNVFDSEFGIDALPLKSVSSQIRFPSRLILPKGSTSGLPLQVFVFVVPYVQARVDGWRNNLDINLDALSSPGFPLDLDMEIQQLYKLSNAFLKDIIITHKSYNTSAKYKSANTFNEVSDDRVWPTDGVYYESSNGPLASAYQPEYANKKFDYQSKKNQFGKRPNYSSERTVNYNNPKPQEQNKSTDNFSTIKIEDQIENTDIMNNINTTLEINRKIDKNVNVYKIVDKYSVNNSLHKEVNEEVSDESNETNKIKPPGLITMPEKRLSDIFNSVLEPKKQDAEERVYI